MKCPLCQSDLQEDFGLIHCSSCQATLMVDIDGQVHVKDDVASSHTDEKADGVEEHVVLGEKEGEIQEEVEEALEESEVFLKEEPALTEDVVMEAEEQEEQEEQGEQEAEDWEEEEQQEEMRGATEEEVVGKEVVEAKEQEQDERKEEGDLVVRGKEEKDSSFETQGPFSMNLFFSGIDTVQKKKDFEEILFDEAFLWDVEKIMSSIQKGQLQMEGLSVVKASILVNRIKHLGIQVRWEQKIEELL